MTDPNVLVGVFTLIGTLLGALLAGGFSFLVTTRTLRHQETAWQREIHLRELERQRAEVEQLIVDLGEIETFKESDGKFRLGAISSAAARSTFYRLITWQARLEDKPSQRLDRGDLAEVLTQLEAENRRITRQINEIIEL